MASPKNIELSATELELKRRGRRRLIGAITLGLLIVVFLPMFFDAEPKRDKVSQQEISIQLPPKDGLAPLPAPIAKSPAPTAAQAPAADAAASANKPASATAKVVTAEPEKKAADKKVDDTTPPTQATAKLAPAKVPGAPANVGNVANAKQGFVVQIGAFNDADNAKQTVARMKEAKLPVYTDNIATKNGNVTRVRVGPFKRKEQAEAAMAQVKLGGADGKVVPLP